MRFFWHIPLLYIEIKASIGILFSFLVLYLEHHSSNPFSSVLFFRKALNLGVLRDPGSEVEDRQYQIDLQSISVGTTKWEQLNPLGEGTKAGTPSEGERSSQNPALEWNMATR